MKNPYIHAFLAFVYILGMATFMQTVPETYFDSIVPVLAITTVLSLLVLSVALMGFLFFHTPAQLFLEKRYEEAVQFFLKTLVSFGVLVILLILGIIFLAPVDFTSAMLL